jgi:putative ABC transport system ATP-binding protein
MGSGPAEERWLLAASEVSRRYALPDGGELAAVDGVSLEIARGEVVALSGPSGSGKSTLLHLMGALDRPDGGRLRCGRRDLGALTRRQAALYRREVGFVFQRFNLLPALTALDNVMAPVLPVRVRFDPAERARGLIAAVGLAGREDALPARLSGGQQQRVAIARALINQPALILADEPTGNLDSATGAGIMDLLLGLRDSQGVTIVLATHDAEIAARCDRTLHLRDGRLVDVPDRAL